jgi:ribose transport system substrate-binding protein
MKQTFQLARIGAALAAYAALIIAGCERPAPQGTAAGPAQGGEATKAAPAKPAEQGGVKAGKYTLLAPLTDLTDRARAKQNVEDTLITNPDINCVVGLWSYNGPAILSAVKDANKQGKVQIVCFDEEDDTLQGVGDGHIFATVVQQPYEFGYQSVKVLTALAKGDKSVVPANKILDVPVKVIRKDGAQAYRTQLKEQIKAGSAELPETTGAQVRVAFVTNNASDFWRIARAGIRKAEAELGTVCEFHIPPSGTADDQQRIVEALIAKKLSGLAISPNDPANQTDLLNRAAESMNVITQDSDAPASKRACYVGTDNYKAGRVAGQLIKEVLPDGGTLRCFVGRLDAQNAKERYQGILDELEGKPAK